MKSGGKSGRVKAAFFSNDARLHGSDVIDYVYAQGRRELVVSLTDMYPPVVTGGNFYEHAGKLSEIEVIFSTWGMPSLSSKEIRMMPSLKAVFYAAGSVKCFAYPFFEHGVSVYSSWGANAVSVAEFCLGQILLTCKGYFRNTADCRSFARNDRKKPFLGRGAYGEKVALIGAGQIGRRLIGLLRPFHIEILVVDPYLSDEEAKVFNVRKVTLEEAFREAYVVSNHLPNLPGLQKVLTGKLFASMRENATFINTGRGAQVNEPELIEKLKSRRDLTALLDVTDPEPCPPDSELRTMPNVHISNHMAGAHDDEVVRMADFMIEDFKRWHNGEAPLYAITPDMLDRMA